MGPADRGCHYDAGLPMAHGSTARKQKCAADWSSHRQHEKAECCVVSECHSQKNSRPSTMLNNMRVGKKRHDHDRGEVGACKNLNSGIILGPAYCSVNILFDETWQKFAASVSGEAMPTEENAFKSEQACHFLGTATRRGFNHMLLVSQSWACQPAQRSAARSQAYSPPS